MIHRPLKFVANPLVSAAMVLETFMEAARILYPHLEVRGVRQVRFMDMIECPPGAPRTAKISCRRADPSLREVWCEVSTPAISPTGRLTDLFTLDCQGQVGLEGGEAISGGAGGFSGPARRAKDAAHGIRSRCLPGMKTAAASTGRYRVIEVLDGAGPGWPGAEPPIGRPVISPICGTPGTNTLPTCSKPLCSWLTSPSSPWTRRSADPCFPSRSGR